MASSFLVATAVDYRIDHRSVVFVLVLVIFLLLIGKVDMPQTGGNGWGEFSYFDARFFTMMEECS